MVVENAVHTFIEQGYLRRSEGKLSLTDTFASDESAQAIEARLVGYLLRRSGETGF